MCDIWKSSWSWCDSLLNGKLFGIAKSPKSFFVLSSLYIYIWSNLSTRFAFPPGVLCPAMICCSVPASEHDEEEEQLIWAIDLGGPGRCDVVWEVFIHTPPSMLCLFQEETEDVMATSNNPENGSKNGKWVSSKHSWQYPVIGECYSYCCHGWSPPRPTLQPAWVIFLPFLVVTKRRITLKYMM